MRRCRAVAIVSVDVSKRGSNMRGFKRQVIAGCIAACVFGAAPASAGAGLLNVVAKVVPPALQSGLTGQGRGFDQMTNPDYIARALPDVTAYLSGSDTTGVLIDPFRKNWGDSRGTVRAISYLNRYGARISGHVWAPKLPFRDPVTGATTNGPLPAVIMLNGNGDSEQEYWGIDQSLAEAGYVVMSFDPQGAGASDVNPNPASTFCDPNGSWRQPQEIGIREAGTCAGVSPAVPTPGVLGPLADAVEAAPVAGGVVAAVAFLELQLADRSALTSYLTQLYDVNAPRFVFGALDAVAWLRSAANPLRSLVDTDRVGLMGHSLGAYSSLVAGNGDPLHRFSAVVTYDDTNEPTSAVSATVPTMMQIAEEADIPGINPVNQDDHGGARTSQVLRAAHATTMQVALRGSTHQEWGYLPFQLANPITGPFFNASSKGGRVGVYYAQAWLDRFLKGKPVGGTAAEAAQRTDATRRLLARTFDGSVDGSSIGQGTYDLLKLKNRPYTIAGDKVSDALSLYLRSAYSFDGHECMNAQRGC